MGRDRESTRSRCIDKMIPSVSKGMWPPIFSLHPQKMLTLSQPLTTSHVLMMTWKSHHSSTLSTKSIGVQLENFSDSNRSILSSDLIRKFQCSNDRSTSERFNTNSNANSYRNRSILFSNPVFDRLNILPPSPQKESILATFSHPFIS